MKILDRRRRRLRRQRSDPASCSTADTKSMLSICFGSAINLPPQVGILNKDIFHLSVEDLEPTIR